MNKNEFIALIRLAKKVYNTQQEALTNGMGYLGMLEHTKVLSLKLDVQLKSISPKTEVHYEWMPGMLHALRQWRQEQRMYSEHNADSRMRAARVLDMKLEEYYKLINKYFPEVLSNPNTQTSLL